MKFSFIILLVLLGCTNNDSTKPVLEVTPEDLAVDSDQDGVGDLYEMDTGRDPHVADISTGELPAYAKVTFVSHSGEEEIFTAPPVTRSLRDFLIKTIQTDNLAFVAIPLTNQQKFRLSSKQRFWQLFHQGYDFQTMRLNSSRETQSVDKARLGQGEVVLAKVHTEKEVELLLEVNYRLIISTPRSEQIFFISPKLSPKDFLRKRFKASFDSSEKLVSLGGFHQTIANVRNLTNELNEGLWKTVNLPLNLEITPRAGANYAVVYTTFGEYTSTPTQELTSSYPLRSFAPVIKNSYRDQLLTIFVPHGSQLRTLTQNKTLEWTTGGSNGGQDYKCYYTTVANQGYAPTAFSNAEQFLELLNIEGHYEVLWSEVFEKGLMIQLQMKSDAAPLKISANESLVNQRVSLGVTETGCTQRVPLSRQTILLWENLEFTQFWETAEDT